MDDHTARPFHIRNGNKRFHYSEAGSVPRDRDLTPFEFGPNGNNGKSVKRSDYRPRYATDDIRNTARRFAKQISELGINKSNPETDAKHGRESDDAKKSEYLDDGIWYGYLCGRQGFRKGLMISEMQDGVIECPEDCDTFQVYSNTSNYRIVDMNVCKCTCPNNREICSHLIGVALFHRFKRNYIGKVVVFFCIEQYFKLSRYDPASLESEGGVIRNVINHLNDTFRSKRNLGLYNISLELLIGILYRCYQKNTDSLPSIVPLSGDDITSSNKFDEDENLVNEQVECSFNGLENTELKCSFSSDIFNIKQVLYDLVHVIGEFSGYLGDSSKDLILNSLVKMLEDRYTFKITNEAKLYLSEVIDEYRKSSDLRPGPTVSNVFYFTDVHSLCFDYIHVYGGKKGLVLNKERYSSQVKSATRLINDAPLLLNLYDFTLWNYMYKDSLGSLPDFLHNEKTSFLGSYSFLYINDKFVLKVKSPDCYINDFAIVQEIANGFNDCDAIKVLSIFITLLLKKRSISHLPDLSIVKTTIEKRFKENDKDLNNFLFIMFLFAPTQILVPFARLFLLESHILSISTITNLFNCFNSLDEHSLYKVYPFAKFVSPFTCINNILTISIELDLDYVIPPVLALLESKAENEKIVHTANPEKRVVVSENKLNGLINEEIVEDTYSGNYYVENNTGRQLIEEIRVQEFGIGLMENYDIDEGLKLVLKKQRDRISRAVKRLSEDLYNSKTQLQLELIQNADDNCYSMNGAVEPFISFFLDDKSVVMMNNEDGFVEKDIRSICDIGSSTKILKTGKTGKFGIGFKSIFILTSNPHIFSNGYSFMFSNDPLLENNIEYILPHWVELSDYSPVDYVKDKLESKSRHSFSAYSDKILARVKGKNLTLMYFPLKDEYLINDYYEKYYKLFQTLELESIVFLRNITTVHFYNNVDGVETLMNKKLLSEFLVKEKEDGVYIDGFRLVQLNLEKKNIDSLEVVDSVFMHVFVVDHSFRLTSEESKMLSASKANNNSSVISIGIPTSPATSETTRCKLYNSLPIGDYGLNFMVNADFVLSANRQNLFTTDPWNEIVVSKLCDVYISIIDTIKQNYSQLSILYTGFVHSIPRQNDGIGLFKYSCNRIFTKLLNVKWVLVDELCEFVEPYKSIFVCSESSDDFSSTEILYSKLLTTILPSKILGEHCEFYYIDRILCNSLLKSKLVELGVNIITFDLVVYILSSIFTKISINSRLCDQPPSIIHILDHMGEMLYLMSLLHNNQDLEDLKRIVVFYNSVGDLFLLDSNVYYCPDACGFNDKQMKIIAHSIFENRLGIEDYGRKITEFLVKLGCTEINSENFLISLILNQATLLADNFEKNSYKDDHELFRQSLHIIKTLVDNAEMCKNFDIDTITLVRRLPIKLESGMFTSLGSEGVKSCPSYTPANFTGVNDQLCSYFMDVRSFYKHLNDPSINPLYISDEYFENVNTDSLLEFFSFIGIPTFIKYVEFTISPDIDAQIQTISISVDCSHEYFLAWKDEVSKVMETIGSREITDYASFEFSKIVDALNRLLTDLNHDHSYFLAKLLHKIMEYESILYPHYLKSKFCIKGRSVDFASSLFYFQLKFLPWIPYGQMMYLDCELDVVEFYGAKFQWKFTDLLGACDRVDYHPLITKTVDPHIGGVHLSKKGIDLVCILEILATICKLIEEYKSGMFNSDGRICKNFAYDSFIALLELNDNLGVSIILKILREIYYDLQRILSDESKYSETIKNSFDKNLLVVRDSDLGLMAVRPSHKLVSIYKTIDHPEFSYLSCIYGECATKDESLIRLWKTIGVREHIGIEGSVAFLDTFTERIPKSMHDIAPLYTTIAHLYNITDKEMFLKLVCNRSVIPVVKDISSAFKYFDCDDKLHSLENVELAVPLNGLITIKTPESVDAIKHFGRNSISLVCKPGVSLVKKSWIDILDLLNAKDFISNCQIKTLDKDNHSNDVPFKLFVLVPILPYAHEYLKSNESPYYSTTFSTDCGWSNFEKVMANLDIYTTKNEINAYYEYVNGKDRLVSRKFPKKSILYQTGGKISLLVCSSVYGLSDDKIATIRNLFSNELNWEEIMKFINLNVNGYNSNLNLPLEFFTDIACLLFSKYGGVKLGSEHCGNVKLGSEHLTRVEFLSKFLCSVYKMIGKSPNELHAFLSIFCEKSEGCNCNVESGSNFSGYGVHLGKGIGCNAGKLDPFTMAVLKSIYSRINSVPAEDCHVDYAPKLSHVADPISCEMQVDDAPTIMNDALISMDGSINHDISTTNHDMPINTTSHPQHRDEPGPEETFIESIDTTKFAIHDDRENFADQFSFENDSDVSKRKSTGKFGEELVYEILMQIYEEEIELKTCKILWHNKFEESGFPFDITIARPNQETYIEVKSSVSVTKTAFEISYNEWLFAQTKGINYEIYRISGIGTKDLKISRIVNPYLQWKSGKLGFCLAL